MWACRRYGRILASSSQAVSVLSVRHYTRKVAPKSQLKALSPTAKKLLATGIWGDQKAAKEPKPTKEPKPEPGAAPKKTKRARGPAKAKRPAGDAGRVNIVSEDLCDDALSYLRESLGRHRGCDILDLYPGTGLWSQKLHDALEPRSHILMEPDETLYQPFLQPLLDRPGVSLVPTSGLVWRDLSAVLGPDHLPHQQVPKDVDGLSKRNDTLLVTANIAFHPKRKLGRFESIATLLLHQYIDAIRTNSIFQRYGLVRMLVWTRHDDLHNVMGETVQGRKRMAVDLDLYCDWFRQVVNDGKSPHLSYYARDLNIELHSAVQVDARMKEAGMEIPKGRESDLMLEARSRMRGPGVPELGSVIPEFPSRASFQRFNDMKNAHGDQDLDPESEDYKAMQMGKWRVTADNKKSEIAQNAIKGLEKLIALHKPGSGATAAEIEEQEAQWNAEIRAFSKSNLVNYSTCRDNLHLVRQSPPVGHWDRRRYEPLVAKPREFLPNAPCSLVDIQPRAPHPLLRQVGPDSSRAGDMFDLVVKSMMGSSSQPLSKALDSIWPGAAEFIMPRWESIHDVVNGGLPRGKSGFLQMTPRMLNTRQWEELLELWMEWPFRPSYRDLIGREADDETALDSV